MQINNNVQIYLRYAAYLIAVLPIFLFRDFTLGNELRYLSIADEALRNGTLFTFTNHGAVYADKPPLYLWIVMLGKSLFGTHNMLFLGMFSFLPALIILAIMDSWVKNVLTTEDRIATQLMLLTSGFFMGSGIVLRMDMLMSMFIVLSLRVFFRIYEDKSCRLDWLLFPLFVFMAIFTKGPLGILIPLISTVVFLFFKGQLNTFRKYWGWKTFAVILALSGFWFFCVYVEGGSRYLNNILFNQTVNRAFNSFSHKEPFYYYLISIFYSLAPWSLVIIGIFIAWFFNRKQNSDLELYFFSIAASTLVVLSLFSSKLAVYLLPAFPFFVYTAMLWLSQVGLRSWMKFLILIPSFLVSLALPVLATSSWVYFQKEIDLSPVIFVAAFCLSVAGIATIISLRKNQITRAIISFSSGILVTVFIASLGIPNYNNYIGLRQISDLAKTEAKQSGIVNYYFVGMVRCENLDVYLNVVPRNIRTTELFRLDSVIKKPAIIFTRKKAINQNDTLRRIVHAHHPIRSGNHYFFKIEK